MAYIIGLILGGMLALSGAGGVIAVPLIMIFLGLPVNEAMGTALGAVMLSAAIGVCLQRRHVLIFPALILGLTGMLSAPLGRTFATLISEVVLLIGFLVISAVIAVLMWKSANKGLKQAIVLHEDEGTPANKAARPPIMDSVHSALRRDRAFVMTMLLSGLMIGTVSGLLGIGGGVFMVPFLRWFLRINMIKAIATSMLTVLLISASGFLTGLLVHNQADLLLTAKLSVAAMTGTLIGHKLGAFCQDHQLQKLFSLSLLLMSFLAIAKEF